jgi:hypothetical protein
MIQRIWGRWGRWGWSRPYDTYQWIGLRDNLQESTIFNGKIHGFRLRLSRLNQSIDMCHSQKWWEFPVDGMAHLILGLKIGIDPADMPKKRLGT